MYTFEYEETTELFAAFGRIGNYLMTEVCPKLRWEVSVTRDYVVGELELRMTLVLVNPRELTPESRRKGCAASVRCEFVRCGTHAGGATPQKPQTFRELCATCMPSEAVVWIVQNWGEINSEVTCQANLQREFVRDLGAILPGRSCEV